MVICAPEDQLAVAVSFSKNCRGIFNPAKARYLREPPSPPRRMLGGVGAGGEIPPATRLCDYAVVKDNVLTRSHGLVQFGQFLKAGHCSPALVSSICIARLST